MLRTRKPAATLVVAGSREIPGAAILAANAALRSGAGKLTIATVQSIASGLALAVPESRVIALAETAHGAMHRPCVNLLDHCAASSDAVLIGPGMIDAPGSCDFVQALLAKLPQVPVILDALAMDVVLRESGFHQPILLTPHAGEMAHLTGRSEDDVLADALDAARDMARQNGIVVALKQGATTFIVPQHGSAWQHVAANPGLATSGSGDVLAGIVAGIAARGAALEQAAAWGVVIHAIAGRRLAESQAPLGFLARELLPEVPRAIGEI